jgi:mRNA interferase RelE/StbE
VSSRDGWQVEFARAAQRDLRHQDPQIRSRVLTAIKALLTDPPAGDIKRLAGVEPPEWRLRVGDWRVRFTRDPGWAGLGSATLFCESSRR